MGTAINKCTSAARSVGVLLPIINLEVVHPALMQPEANFGKISVALMLINHASELEFFLPLRLHLQAAESCCLLQAASTTSARHGQCR